MYKEEYVTRGTLKQVCVLVCGLSYWSAHMLLHFGLSAVYLKLSWVGHKRKHYSTAVTPDSDKSMHRLLGICVGEIWLYLSRISEDDKINR